MTYKYDALVFIGRFQPFHNGHKRVIDRALELSKKVIVLIGSANSGRSMRNPFNYIERDLMINECYDGDNRVITLGLNDHTYNDDGWIREVQSLVKNQTKPDDKIGLIGCEKDHTSYYLKLFPTWGNESVEFLDPINATDLREIFWSYGATRKSWSSITGEHTNEPEISKYITPETLEILQTFEKGPEYQRLKSEQEFIEVYKKSVNKYPRIEHTVDAVVVQSGHILLVRRRSEPGKGLWALPGGFIHEYEKLENAMIRELKEETKLKVPEAVLRGSIKESKTYDDPHRSARGRLITQAFLISLPAQTSLPKVKGSDDADKAKWVPLNELNPKKMFEDHYFIVKDLLGVL
jgi:bifunctional NMN adenylyltransferase/nudix hydrolase